jgi:serine/threonine protein kinase
VCALLPGLAYLHAQRTVHRDVKGANLLVEKNGRIKLADFGMAKQMVEAVSFTKSFKGSAFWMVGPHAPTIPSLKSPQRPWPLITSSPS